MNLEVYQKKMRTIRTNKINFIEYEHYYPLSIQTGTPQIREYQFSYPKVVFHHLSSLYNLSSCPLYLFTNFPTLQFMAIYSINRSLDKYCTFPTHMPYITPFRTNSLTLCGEISESSAAFFAGKASGYFLQSFVRNSRNSSRPLSVIVQSKVAVGEEFPLPNRPFNSFKNLLPAPFSP